MAIIEAPDHGYEVASDADLRDAVRHALGRLGLTWEELEGQAFTGRFQSEQARMTWMAIRDLGALR